MHRIVRNESEFYGTKNKDKPYQSVYYGPQKIVDGRRQDIHDRFMKIDIVDIRGKTVADIGCNIGVSGMLAWFYGAKSVDGFEYSSEIVKAALRLSTLLNSNITFHTQDMGKKLSMNRQFDTTLCFSLYAHVEDKKQLASNIAAMTRKVLYFEGHAQTSKKNYKDIFKHFRRVDLVGYNADGIHSEGYSRPFFRCVK